MASFYAGSGTRAADAFTRRTGGGSYYSKAARTARREGKLQGVIRSEARQYSREDYVKVRAYRRRHPDPPEPRKRGRVKVRGYWRRRGIIDWLKASNKRDWINYLADFYGISKTEARKMERKTK